MENPYEIFQKECPNLADSFNQLVEAQKSLEGLDAKTKQLINIAIQTAHSNPMGVKLHAQMARKIGATREEVKGAVVINLHLSGLSPVLNCLPAALKGYDLEFKEI
jgi:AhpD family alkylhydroperoxidase